jgi:hypothetical protein
MAAPQGGDAFGVVLDTSGPERRLAFKRFAAGAFRAP